MTNTLKILDNDTVILTKTAPLDKEFAHALNTILSEWSSANDEENFSDLQNI
jgi:hypothetical protein